MKALQFRLSWIRIALARILGMVWSGAFTAPWSPLTCVDVPDPELPGPDWLLLKTSHCGICGSDLSQVFLRGAADNPVTSFISFPHVMGHEISGIVDRVGASVEGWSKGDRVVVYPWLTCEVRGRPACAACKRGAFPHCDSLGNHEDDIGPGMHLGTSSAVSGGFAPSVAVHRAMCFRIPANVSLDVAALADPFSVALHAVLKSPPRPGDRVVVIGAGTLGLSVVHVIDRLFPGVDVLVVDRHEHLGSLAKQMGAEQYSMASGTTLLKEVAAWTGARVFRPTWGVPWCLEGVDLVLDTVGTPQTVETDLRIVKADGVVVVVGVSPPARFEWTPLYFKDVTLLGSNSCGVEVFEGRRVHGFQLFLDLLESGRVDPSPIITHQFSFPDYQYAFQVARNKGSNQSVKVLLNFA